MTSTVAGTRPPRAAIWLIDLFAAPGEAEPILGDLHEEFSAVADRAGESAARHWYWRQCARTLGHLMVGPFGATPLRSLAVTGAGLALSVMMRRAVTALAPMVVGLSPSYFFLFWVAANVLAQVLTGCTIACIGQRRPMAAALSVVFAMGAVMAVTEPIVYLSGRLLLVGGPMMLGAAMAARRLKKDYGAAAALGR